MGILPGPEWECDRLPLGGATVSVPEFVKNPRR